MSERLGVAMTSAGRPSRKSHSWVENPAGRLAYLRR